MQKSFPRLTYHSTLLGGETNSLEATGGTTGSVSQSEVPSGLGYYAAYAEQVVEKMDKVVNGDPDNLDLSLIHI